MTRALNPQERAALEQYATLLRQYRAQLDAPTPLPLRQREGEALLQACLQAGGGAVAFPNERFKYTRPLEALAPDYGLNLQRRPFVADPSRQYRCSVTGLDAWTLYVVGDVVYPLAADAEPLPEGVYVGPLSAHPDPMAVRARFSDAAWLPDAADPTSWVNSMLVQDALLVCVPDGVKLPRPVQVVNMADASKPLMAVRRILVYMGQGSEASLVVCDHANGTTPYLTTQDVSLELAEGARLSLYGVEETTPQTTRYSNLRAMQQADSRLSYNHLTLQCGTSRTTLRLMQPTHDAVAEVCGAVVADGEEHADHYVRVEHGGSDNRSDMLFKYVLGGVATGVFTGEVFVEPGARRIASEQQSANLLTTTQAHVYARPVLEIYADDVRCNHGATVGKLDETALFYMQQRGIAEAEARLLLQHAFVNDVLQRIAIEPLRERLSSLVERRFRTGRAHCDGCRIAGQCRERE